MLPVSMLIELVEARVKDPSDLDGVTYIEDELYDEFVSRLSVRHRALEHPEPNIVFRSTVIRPMSAKKVCKECGRVL